jgi:hypothetical protein
MEQASPSWLIILKDIANIVFFFGVPTLALLAYSQARKTIFSSQKTEVFKKQLELLDKTSAYFNFYDSTMLIEKMKLSSIGENSLSAAYHLPLLAHKNSERPIDGSFTTADNWHSDSAPQGCLAKEKQVNGETQFREIYALFLSKDYMEERKTLRNLASSIFLPDDIKKLIESFEQALPTTFPLILNGVNSSLDSMMQKCTVNETPLMVTKQLSFHWMNNLRDAIELKELLMTAQSIQDKIKSYANVDKVWS